MKMDSLVLRYSVLMGSELVEEGNDYGTDFRFQPSFNST